MRKESIIKTMTIIYSISSVFILVVGFALIISDAKYLQGIQYLISSILLFYAMYNINKNNIDLTQLDSSTYSMFSLGFIFLIVGLNINIGIWALGLIFFTSSLFKLFNK